MALVGQAAVLAPRDPETALQIIAVAWAVLARNGGTFPPFFQAFAQRIRAGAAANVTGDVVRLVAKGLSNKEIAGRLHLSVRTVESHLRHALTKTGLVNRTQLATCARTG